MALDKQHWNSVAAVLSTPSLHALHQALSNVAKHDRQTFDAHRDFRDQTDIIEAELKKRGEAFSPIP